MGNIYRNAARVIVWLGLRCPRVEHFDPERALKGVLDCYWEDLRHGAFRNFSDDSVAEAVVNLHQSGLLDMAWCVLSRRRLAFL